MPVRAEQVTVSKDVFVRERVVVRRSQVADVAHVQAQVRREELRVDTVETTEEERRSTRA